MGSCISKCKPKKKSKQEDNSHVQDKLIIISQDPISSIPPKITTMPLENLKPLSPAPSSTSSTSSFSSFSCSTNNIKSTNTVSSLSSSSSSSCSSSSLLLLSAKDRSFSNEYLWSCVKENPHIIGHKDQKTVVSDHNKTKQSTQEKPNSTPRKRARANSPTLVRQKSFRKEQSFASLPNRGLRSPSPSRRFNSDNNRNVPTNENNSCRHHKIVSKGNSVSSGLKRESFRATSASPNRGNFSVRKKDTMFSQQVSMKIDDHVDVGDIKGMEEMDVVMEDINNPLIALDCFIFL